MKGFVEPNASSGTFDDQLCNGETKSYTTDVRSGMVTAGEEPIEDFGVLSRRYTWPFILDACLEP